MRNKLKKWFYTKILRRHYYKSGACLGCGKCCTKIYVKNAKNIINDEKDFERLKKLHPFYTYLKVIGKDETGLIFECENLDSETHLCKIHDMRPKICRRYPQEELFMMGGSLSENCGYKFEPIEAFAEVFERIQKKRKKN